MQRTSEQEGSTAFSPSKTVQYWVLYCIYYATNGYVDDDDLDTDISRQDATGTWKNTLGWESNNRDPCTDGWHGISCDEVQQVQEIRLQRNGLTNVFPFNEVAFLSAGGAYHLEGVGSLRRLNIFENQELTSDESLDAWMSSMLGLEVLNYRYTSIGKSGPIPRLPSTIQEFDCSYSGHVGPLQEETFGGLNVLVLASLDGNQFQSPIPTALASLPNLQFLYVRDSSLNGNLAYMERMTSIVEHAVDNNPSLSGPVFSSIGSLFSLRSFSASDCSLTGTLPTELGSNLVQMWLHGNDLQGPIPIEYSTMNDLRILSLEDNNNLSGTMPIEICLNRFDGELDFMSVDCDSPVDCSAFFPDCCTCCGRSGCGS
ncbi:MAG: hypothetical protein SGARI_003657 [Bacillariaceae sp.]